MEDKNERIKAQEWTVKFDGKIKLEKKFFTPKSYKVKNQGYCDTRVKHESNI